MKRITKILSSVSVSLLLSSSGLLGLGIAHAAGSATMSLSPASGSAAQGTTLSIPVHEDSGSTTVYGARIAITYPSSLTFVSFTPSSAYSITAVNKGGAGTAEYDAGASGVTGDQVVATVNFTVNQGSGSAAVGVSAPNLADPNDYTASAISDSGGNNILASNGTSGGSYTLTGAPAGGSSGTGSGSSSSGSSSSASTSKTASGSSGTAAATTTTPATTISDVTVIDLTGTTASISWKTSIPTTSEVDYGLNTNYGWSAIDGSLTVTHQLALDARYLAPGTTFHYLVKGTDASGKFVSSPDAIFTTKGITLTLSLVDQHNKALHDASVTVGSANGTTDSSGKVTLGNVPIGNVKATIVYNGVTTSKTLDLTSASNQAQTIKVNVPGSSTVWILPIVIIAILVALLAIVRMLVLKRRDNSAELARHFPKLPGSGGGPSSGTIAPNGGTPPGGSGAPPSAGSTINPNKQP